MTVETNRLLLNPDLEFIRNLKLSGGGTLKKCYQCATCSVVCNLAPRSKPFPRKEMMLAQWGLKEELLSDPDIWLCHQCGDCSTYCPRQAKPGDVLGAVRAISFQHYAFPAFMGKALANPAALPLLFLFPLLVLLGVLFSSSGNDLSYLFEVSGEVDYARAFPHGILEMIFIGGNAIIFAFAAVGLMRFWNNLKMHNPGNRTAFFAALLTTGLEIIPHRKFADCGANRPRFWGHLLVFYGFIGAMATAGLALFATVILRDLGSPVYLTSPIDLPHPIKILGVVSGIAIVAGGMLLIVRRWMGGDDVGASAYHDWLFLITLFLVGITGMFAWILRIAEIPVLGYLDYYLHLVLVFFLLWYAPYSKFAHMFYRTLALTFAKSGKRDVPRSAQQVT